MARAPLARARTVAPPVALVAALVGAWQWAVVADHIAPDVLPTPGRVARQGWAFRSQLWANTVPTLYETAAGFIAALVAGMVFAVVMDFSRAARRGLYPVLVASQTLPITAIAPLIVIWFGFGLLPKMLVVALVTFFPITVSLMEGLNSAEKDATNLLRSMGAGRVAIFLKLRLPGALPQLFGGLRIAITYAVVSAVFAEYVGAEKGLGIYMQLQKNSFRTDLVLAAVAVTAVISVALFSLTYALQRLLIPWYRLSRAPSTTG
jgi:ABC-type nitrate/sulfonate/bicarbonate transport system permease component